MVCKQLPVQLEPTVKPASGGVRRGTGELNLANSVPLTKFTPRRRKGCLFRCKGRRSGATIPLCAKRRFYLYG